MIAMARLLSLASNLSPTGEIGDGMVAEMRDLAARAEAEIITADDEWLQIKRSATGGLRSLRAKESVLHRTEATAELVEALKEAVRSLEWWERNEPGSFGNIERNRLEGARAALAKHLTDGPGL